MSKPLTRSRLARIFAACSTPARALRAHAVVARGPRVDLTEALWCRAMELTCGNADQAATWRRLRDEALERVEVTS